MPDGESTDTNYGIVSFMPGDVSFYLGGSLYYI